MADRITEVAAVASRGVFKNPGQRAVGRRVRQQHRIVAGQVSHPGFIELENRLRRFPGKPLRLRVSQRVQIEFRALGRAVSASD